MITTISFGKLEQMMEQNVPMTIIDLRSPEEFSKGHIIGAVNFPYEKIEQAGPQFDRSAYLVFYCQHGGQSLKAAREYDRKGFQAISVGSGFVYYRGKYRN